jgi:hypothetical protein
MLRERIANSESIDAEYSNTFIKLTETTTQELDQIKKSALGDRQLSPFEKVITEQQATARALQAKESDYQARTTSAYSLYGQNPFFLMKELSFKKIMDSLQTSPPNIAVAYAAIDDAYRSALELKRLSLQKDILAGQLEQSSQTAEQFLTGTQAEKSNSTTTLDAKLRFINQEKNIHLQLLPEFLLKKVSSLLGVTTGLPLSSTTPSPKTSTNN